MKDFRFRITENLRIKKIRTFRPLANKGSTPVAVGSINLSTARRPPRASLVRQDVFRARECEDSREKTGKSSLIADEGYHLARLLPPPPPPENPSASARREKKRGGGGSDRRGRCGNKNIDGSVPGRGRDNRLIIHRPRDRAGYSGTSTRARALARTHAHDVTNSTPRAPPAPPFSRERNRSVAG